VNVRDHVFESVLVGALFGVLFYLAVLA